VAAKHKAENRARPGAGSIPWPEPRPLPWPGSGQGTHGSHWWRAQFGSPARIREWAAQELTNGRLLPWFAVAYGAGVILYFTALAALFMNMSRYSGGQDNEFWLESWNGDHFNFERKNNATR